MKLVTGDQANGGGFDFSGSGDQEPWRSTDRAIGLKRDLLTVPTQYVGSKKSCPRSVVDAISPRTSSAKAIDEFDALACVDFLFAEASA